MPDSRVADELTTTPAGGADSAAVDRKTPPPRKKRRWLRRLVLLFSVGFVLLIGLVAAAPYVLASRAGLDQLTTLASNRIVGWVEVDSATLSWFSPVELRGVRILDADKREVLKVERIHAVNNLLSAIFSGLDFGEATIESPQVALYFDANDDVSLIQAVQPRNAQPTDASTTVRGTANATASGGALPRPRGRIVLTKGRVTAARPGVASVEISDVNVDLRLDSLSTIAGDVSLMFPDAVQAVGKVDLHDLADDASLRFDRVRGTLDLATRGDVQLAPLTAVFAPSANIRGGASVDVKASTEGGDMRGKFAIRLTKVQSQETAGTLAPVDLALTGDLVRVGPQLTAKTSLSGDAGQIDADLGYRFGDSETSATGGRLVALLLAGESAALPEMSLDVHGGLDLARLQKAIPGLVPARPGTAITGGRLDIASIAIRGGAQPTAKGSIALKDFAGTEGGRAIRIEPITFDFDAGVKSGVGVNVSRAELKASFANLTASGDATNLKAEFHSSLAKLQQDLGQLLDLSRLRLGGDVTGQLQLARDGADRVNVSLTAGGNGVRVGTADRNYDVQRLSARQNGSVVMRGGAYERFESSGDVSATGIAIDGSSVLDGESKVEWKNVSLGDAAAGIRAELVRLTSSAANVDAKNIQLKTAGAVSATADVQARSDLGRLSNAIGRLARMPKPPAIGGQLTMDTRVSTTGSAVTLSGRGGIDSLVVGEGASAVREPRVNLEFDAGLDNTTRRVTLTKAGVASSPLTAEIGGTIEQFDGPCVLALRGRYDANWEQFTRVLHELSPATAGNILVSGKSASAFEITGPLNQPGARPAFRNVSSGADVTWSAAELYGVKLGQATLKPALRDGKLTLPMTTIAAADGRVNLGATVDLTAADPTLVMPGSTKLLDNVAMTPIVGQALLSRINPIFLHMTKVEGRANLAVQDLFVPFGDSAKRLGRGTGVLDLQNVRVQPSGFMGLLLELGGYGQDQLHAVTFGKLDFVVRDGRIVYDNFTMLLPPDFDLKFRGSVGLDSTLDLVVSLPVREGLLRKLGVKGPALAAAQKLTGARVELPIVGTRERPQIDFKKVDVAKLLGQAAIPATPEKAVEGILDILQKTQKSEPKKKKP